MSTDSQYDLHILMHLIANEPDISLRSEQNRAKKRITIGLAFDRWPET